MQHHLGITNGGYFRTNILKPLLEFGQLAMTIPRQAEQPQSEICESKRYDFMILPTIHDKRFILIRRGGTMADKTHRQLALWADECAEQGIPIFEAVRPDDGRPNLAIEATRLWANGEIKVTARH
jgi:hypothetical protein